MIDPFFQLKKTKSSGLGLAIVYNIIKNHNGYIELESKLIEGSIFRIFLPYSEYQCKENSNENLELEKELSFEGKKILIVDDNDIVRIIKKIFL